MATQEAEDVLRVADLGVEFQHRLLHGAAAVGDAIQASVQVLLLFRVSIPFKAGHSFLLVAGDTLRVRLISRFNPLQSGAFLLT
jgi:hypothetical protein